MSEQEIQETVKRQVQVAIEESIGTHLTNMNLSVNQIVIFSYSTTMRALQTFVETSQIEDKDSVAKVNFCGYILNALLNNLLDLEIERIQNRQIDLVVVRDGKVEINLN